MSALSALPLCSGALAFAMQDEARRLTVNYLASDVRPGISHDVPQQADGCATMGLQLRLTVEVGPDHQADGRGKIDHAAL